MNSKNSPCLSLHVNKKTKKNTEVWMAMCLATLHGAPYISIEDGYSEGHRTSIALVICKTWGIHHLKCLN